MKNKPNFIRGHKTMVDGTSAEMTREEGERIWAEIEEAKNQRAKQMPTVRDALGAVSAARQRFRELGWFKGGPLMFRKEGEPDLRNSIDWAVIEEGSTGIFYAQRCDKYFHYSDCVSAHNKVYAKKAADLTPDEKVIADKCEASHVEYMEKFHAGMAKRYSTPDKGAS